jgi:hypothetical protein
VKLFDFDPHQFSSSYAKRGWVHIPSGLSAMFFAVLLQQVETQRARTKLPEFQLGGKQQALYEFPSDSDYFAQLREAVAGVTGLALDDLVLAERHIKAYEVDAEADPVAHKDRFASEVSVGFSVRIPEASRLVIYPRADVGPNPYHSWAELRRELPPERSPQRVLEGAEEAVIADRPGDVVMFRGSALWHKRRDPANAIVIYLKLNTFNCDTLAEDPGTSVRRERTRRLLRLEDAALGRCSVELGRRMEYVEQRSSRDWQERIRAYRADAPPLEIDAVDLAILRAIGTRVGVDRLVQQFPRDLGVCSRVRRLAAEGVLDLAAREQLASERIAA